MRIAILGAGISGLSAAWWLRRLCPEAEVVVWEASGRVGGLIETVREGGFLFERGPRTFKASRSPCLLGLIDEVGLGGEVLFSNPRANRRYVWRGGQLRELKIWPYVGRVLGELWVGRGTGEETVHAFAKRRFGERVADEVFDPMTVGIYAGDARELLMKDCFPDFVEWERVFGSVLWGAWKTRKRGGKRFPGSLFTLREGMQQLPERIASECVVECHAPVRALEKRERGWAVHTDGRTREVDVVFSALPAREIAKLLPGVPLLEGASLSIVNVGYWGGIRLPQEGYGYLIPSSAKEGLLGMIWDSAVFPEQGAGRLTAMVRADADPIPVVREALERHLGVREPPDCLSVRSWRDAIPWKRWEGDFPQLYLLGNYLSGASVEQCVARSEQVVKKFLNAR